MDTKFYKLIKDHKTDIVAYMTNAYMNMCDTKPEVYRYITYDDNGYIYSDYGAESHSNQIGLKSGNELLLVEYNGWSLANDQYDIELTVPFLYPKYFKNRKEAIQVTTEWEMNTDNWEKFFDSKYPAVYKKMKNDILENMKMIAYNNAKNTLDERLDELGYEEN